jgi:murein DD-endopeptidase MepM/ murein hydrolase activator NlpD
VVCLRAKSVRTCCTAPSRLVDRSRPGQSAGDHPQAPSAVRRPHSQRTRLAPCPGPAHGRRMTVPHLLLALLLGLGPASDPVGAWPLDPEPAVVRGFDPPETPYGAGHRGVDLLGSAGQTVRAALGGRVSYAGPLFGRGVVVVDHGVTRTTYEPVSSSVEVGQTVARGEPVGVLELHGSHCFPRACLHWGWLAGETYLDPLRLVGAGPVRLLPLWRDAPVAEPFSRTLTLAGALGGRPPAGGPW